MPRIRQNRKRSSEDPTNRLDNQHPPIDPQSYPHPPPTVAAACIQRMRVVVRVHAPSLGPA